MNSAMLFIFSAMAVLSSVNALMKIQNPTRSTGFARSTSSIALQQSLSRLMADKSASIGRSASVCVDEFFSSSGKLPILGSESRLSAVRIAGVAALSSAKLPFGKDEAWR
jgi:hypothetical protein